MDTALGDPKKGGGRMNVTKMAVTGVIGFAVGAGMMMLPGNQKLKRQVQRQVDQLRKISRMW